MSESSLSLKGSQAATPDGDGDVEMKTSVQNGVPSDTDSGSIADRKRKTPDASEDEDMGGGGDELFGSDDDVDETGVKQDGNDA